VNKCQTTKHQQVNKTSVCDYNRAHFKLLFAITSERPCRKVTQNSNSGGAFYSDNGFCASLMVRRFQENKDSTFTGCFDCDNSSTMKVSGGYYERLQYGILGIEPVFRDSLPVMRKKLIARGVNGGLVSNTNSFHYVATLDRWDMHEQTCTIQSNSLNQNG